MAKAVFHMNMAAMASAYQVDDSLEIARSQKVSYDSEPKSQQGEALSLEAWDASASSKVSILTNL